MSLGLVLRQRHEQRLELRQELKRKLGYQLLQKIGQEFEGYINIEEDEDLELLMKSLPFLVLHEFSHPLHTSRRLILPNLDYNIELGDMPENDFINNAVETGIDKGSMLVGVTVGYTKEQMIESYSYITERVLRDGMRDYEGMFTDSFHARLCAGLKENLIKTINPKLVERQESLLEKIDEFDKPEEFDNVVEFYRQIYRDTKLSPKYNKK